jgi:hypothetical protein
MVCWLPHSEARQRGRSDDNTCTQHSAVGWAQRSVSGHWAHPSGTAPRLVSKDGMFSPHPNATHVNYEGRKTRVAEESFWALVVMCDAVRRMALFRRVEWAGHRATVADTVRAALDMLATEPFDLVLLDASIAPPESDELLVKLRSSFNLRQVLARGGCGQCYGSGSAVDGVGCR